MNTTAQVKQALKKSSQQLRREPLEILRNVREQVVGEKEANLSEENGDNQKANNEENEKLKSQIAEQESRRYEALENELRDIRRQNLFNSLLQKIQSGVNVPLEEFGELSHEQREVLKAHMEAVQKQATQQGSQQDALVEPEAKRGRRMVAGQKQAAQKQQTRVEKIIPPSG